MGNCVGAQRIVVVGEVLLHRLGLIQGGGGMQGKFSKEYKSNSPQDRNPRIPPPTSYNTRFEWWNLHYWNMVCVH